jgi:CoA:oxalate CoA-transferase
MNLKAQGPLVGIRILEVCEGQAGPYCGALLSDLGAEVIKVESREGDYTRQLGPHKNGESAYFISYNRGKRSVALDLFKERAREIVRELAVHCDIFIENLDPGEIGTLGLDYETLREINPSIIYGSVSCYGRTGPLAGYVGNDIVAEAISGHTFANGSPDGPPEPIGIAISEQSGGTEFAWAILCAYLHKMLTGCGQYVDVSVADKNISMSENVLVCATMANLTRQRTGGYNPNCGPYGVFQAMDGAYAIGCGTNEMWAKVSKVLGRPDLYDAKGWSSNGERGGKHSTHMVPLMTDWGKDKKRNYIVELMRDQTSIPCGACLTHKEVQQDVHYRMRQTIVDIEQPKAGKVSVASPFVSKLSDTRPAVQGPAPLLGEHNEKVLTTILSYTKDEIDRLYEQEVLMHDLDPQQPA